ncbi:hypothetical protein ACP70R_030445 [Stipagrostis hirtigluma subsp. patula]
MYEASATVSFFSGDRSNVDRSGWGAGGISGSTAGANARSCACGVASSRAASEEDECRKVEDDLVTI